MRYFCILFSFCLIFSCSDQPQKEKSKLPNILLIVADDLGYTDLGAFGGDIATPHLDSLAESGIVLSRFHTAPMCAVTRAMLLSGTDNHIAGMGSQDLQTTEFGYEGHLTDRVIPVPQLLKKAGYYTCIAGKWHLGDKADHDPVKKGFDNSFVLLEGAGNHYSNRGVFAEDSISPYTENGKKVDWPAGKYSTDFYTDKLIDYLESNKNSKKPFFGMAAYTSPHWPLQVDPDYWKKYEGMYDDGYEKLRIRRFENLKKLKLIPEDAELPLLHPNVKPWDSLSKEEQKWQSRTMELYAGMVDNLDHNIGRLLRYLRETDQLENTMIIFFSDNGAAANDFYRHKVLGPFLQAHYTEDYHQMGTEESFISYGPQWAEAGSSPFKYFKGYTTEGGTNTPFIVAGKGVRQPRVSHAFTTLLDLAPTLYQYAELDYPESWNGQKVYPLEGESLVPLLDGQVVDVHDSTYVFSIEHRGHISVRQGDWKLVNSVLPFDQKNFELFNLSSDVGEQRDVKNEFPEKFSKLFAEWEAYKKRVKVQFPTPRAGD
ncbi:MAG: arylsulfatase [Bacteroidota bacterium]